MKKIIIILLLFISSIINVEATEIKKDKLILKSCIDGDTAKFILNDQTETVRFLAIDTPETVKRGTVIEPYGKEASKYTCDELKKANIIEIEYDNNSNKYDKYNRLLGWIFVDYELLQDKLVAKGYAKVAYIYGDYKYVDKLKRIEKEAQERKIGIWGNKKNISYIEIIMLFIFVVLLYFLRKNLKKVKLYGIFKKMVKQYKRNINL